MRKFFLAGWLLLGLFGLLGGNALAAGRARPAASLVQPLERYEALAGESETLAQSLVGRPREEITGRLQSQMVRWKSFNAIQQPDGSQTPIDNSYLLALLASDPPQLEKLIYQLHSIQGRPPGGTGTGGKPGDLGCTEPACSAALSVILAGREFQWVEDVPNPLQEWVLQQLEKLMRYFSQLAGKIQIPYLNYLLMGLGALVVLIALFFVVRNLMGSAVRDARLKDEPAAGEEDLTADAALKKAQELSKGGDYRSAVRYLYLSSLLLMEERGLLRYDRSKTNREYLRSVAGQPEIQTRLREVVEVFDRVWYGYQPLDDSDYQRYEANLAELRRQK